jgi:hypothetical protein
MSLLSNHDHVIPMQGNREDIQGKVFHNSAARDSEGGGQKIGND